MSDLNVPDQIFQILTWDSCNTEPNKQFHRMRFPKMQKIPKIMIAKLNLQNNYGCKVMMQKVRMVGLLPFHLRFLHAEEDEASDAW